MFISDRKSIYENRQEISEMCGKLMLYLIEAQSTYHMAEQLKLYPIEVEHNIDEMLYTILKRVGIRRYLRILFWK